MKIFIPSPEARITARPLPQFPPAGGPRQIEVTVTTGQNLAVGLAQADAADLAVLMIDKKGQPRGLPKLFAGNLQPAPLFIESALVTPITQHIERSLRDRSPWRFAFAQLSWMPHTEFGNKAGLNAFARISLQAVDWLIFSAGLVIGIAALPTLYPIVRCVKAFEAVTALRDGMEDVQLANQLLRTARALPEVTVGSAQNVLQVYRGQACPLRMISVVHRSGWSSLAEMELLTYLDSRVPGFSLQVRAQNVQANRNAMLLKLGIQATVIAMQPAPTADTHEVETLGEVATKETVIGKQWKQVALLASAYA